MKTAAAGPGEIQTMYLMNQSRYTSDPT